MDALHDEWYYMGTEKAAVLKDQYESQLIFEKEKLEMLKARKARIIRQLDRDISKLEEDIASTESVIESLDAIYFKDSVHLEGGE